MWKWISLTLFTVLLIGTRLLSSSDNWWLYNVSPFIGLFLCGALYKKRCPWLLPLVAVVWVLTNPISSWMQGYSPFHMSNLVTILALAVIVLLAGLLGKKFEALKSGWYVFGGAVVAAIWYYLATNSVSFLTNPLYEKSWQGYTQAMWFGLPEFKVPTWVFFRNSLCSTVSISMLFFWSMQPVRIKQKEEMGLASVAEKR